MNTQLIITHPGSAYFDEVTAVSLILAVYTDTEFRIERREPLQTVSSMSEYVPARCESKDMGYTRIMIKCIASGSGGYRTIRYTGNSNLRGDVIIWGRSSSAGLSIGEFNDNYREQKHSYSA